MKKLLHTASGLLASNRNVIILLAALGVLVYANSLGNAMFWDDDDFILKNAYIKDFTSFPRFFTDNVIAGAHLMSNYWRPLLLSVFALEWHLWKDAVFGWHAVNTFFHIANSALLFSFLNLLFKDRRPALIVALIFLVHPVQTEAVVYVNGLGDPLATFFGLSGLLFYARARQARHPSARKRDDALALVMFPLALMSKETGLAFFLYLTITHLFLEKTSTTWTKKARDAFLALWPFLAVTVVYALLRLGPLNFQDTAGLYQGPLAPMTQPDVRVWTFFRALALYAGFLVIPFDLRMERLIDPAGTFFLPDVMGGALIFALLVAWGVHSRQKNPLAAFGILWFFAGILPVSNVFFLINGLVYEHWLYVPLVGIALACASAGLRAASTPRRRTALVLTLAVVLIAFAVRAAWRNTDWRNAIVFYEKTLLRSPGSYRVINNLGMEYARANQPDKAEATYKKAIALDPANAVAWHNLGNLCLEAGRRDEALRHFEKAVGLQEDFVFSYPSLARLYLEKKDYPRCRKALEKFFYLAKDKEGTLRDLVNVALREKNFTAARRYLDVLLQVRPDDPWARKTLRKIQKTRPGT